MTTNIANIIKLATLKVLFDTEIGAHEVVGFRSAVAEKVGLEHEWFHNHANGDDNKKLHYRFPLVQYKRHQGRPMLFFIGKGVQEAQRYFAQSDWNLTINKKRHQMNIMQMEQREYNLGVRNERYDYVIRNWQALNQENFRVWHKHKRIVDKVLRLEQILVAHILSFGKGVSWFEQDKIEVGINEILAVKPTKYKRINVQTFDICFSSNVVLPEFLSIGKGASSGFGIIRLNRKRRRNGL